jgi:tRNA A37 threonylcarbamoyladenosine modification protein TsaB
MVLYIDTLGGEAKIWLDDELFTRELGRKMSDELMSFVMDTLDEEEPSGIVVHKDKGSFTGARLGAALANTLAEVYDVPIVAASDEDDEESDWRESGKERLDGGENDGMVEPEYE